MKIKKRWFNKGLRIATVFMFLFESHFVAAQKPNIIYILIDDLGYGDITCYGADPAIIQTPRVDQLAAEGIRFTDGHSPASTCTPSRYSFLTGEYAWRTAGTGIASGVDPLLIAPNKVSLPHMLKAAGYNTAVVGKWHLGLGTGTTDYNHPPITPGPLEIGFDYYFGMPATGDRVPCVFMENRTIYNFDPADPLLVSYSSKVGNQPTATEHPELLVYYDGGTSHSRTIINGIGRIGWMDGATNAWWRDEDFADTFVEKASDFIEKNTNTPFFLYFSTHDIHVPRAPNERFQGTSSHGWRGDAIHEMDWMVGALLDKVDALGLTSNTLVIFSSDNGPAIKDGYNDGPYGDHGSAEANGPFSGGKYSLGEGGTRVPFIVRWPGTVPTNTLSSALISQTDLLASLAALVGQPLPTDAGPDSENVLPALLGQSPIGRTIFVGQNNRSNPRSLRQGNWKYRSDNRRLYNLETDPSESQNLAASYPDRVNEMKSQLNAIAAVPMQSTLLAWWPLSDGNPTNTFDRSLNGWKGTLFGSPISTSDGMRFDGVDDSVGVDNFPSISGSVTLACWARSDSESWNTTNSFISHRSQFVFSPTSVQFYSASGTLQTLAFDSGLSPTNWHHYAASFNAETGNARVFVDGTLLTNAQFAAGSLGVADGSLTVGHFYTGELADVRVYSQLLTPQRMANMASARLLDIDADAMLDDWEHRVGLNPFDPSDAGTDLDGDGISNLSEFINNTAPNIPEPTPPVGLVGYWSLDETNGVSAIDSSGNSYTGRVVNAPVWSNAGGRHYLQFSSAQQQYIEVPGLPSLSTKVTVACWARSNTAQWNIAGSLVSRRPQWLLHPWLNPPADKRLSFMVVTSSGSEKTADINLGAQPEFNLQEWHHYAGTYDAGTGQVKLYVDGLLVDTTTLAPGLLNETTESVWIGRDSTKSRYFEGALDEVRVYDIVLPPDQIMALTYGFDDDADGMPDEVERRIINADPNAAPRTLAEVLPTDDYDGDHSSNQAEAIAGTDPTSATDFFRIVNLDTSGSETPFSIFVDGKKGRTYFLERSLDLDGEWLPIFQFGPLTIDRTVELYDDAPPSTSAFYKVRVENM